MQSSQYYTSNMFTHYFNTHKEHAMLELFDFLEEREVTCYGIEISPSRLRKLKHELMKRGLSVEELQK